MEKLIAISGSLYLVADVLAAASFAHYDWINTGTEMGKITLGLNLQCQTLYLRKEQCFSPDLPTEWVAAKVFLIAAIIGLSLALMLVISAYWKQERLVSARWTAFVAVMCLAQVGILFPIGFRQSLVGGTPMRLPDMWSIGDSYKLLWVFSVVSGFAGWVILMIPMRSWFNIN